VPRGPGSAENRTQERHGGPGAAERANGRVLVWGPHWALGLYGAASDQARNRAKT